jgi:pimeloyl-ACP methyl ester carboxylesterase
MASGKALRSGTITYSRTGAGQPLLLVHALGADRRMWEPVVPELAKRFDVIAVDLPGFGESQPLPAGVAVDPASLARALADLLERLGVGRAHLVGCSLGGWVALELALLGRALSVSAVAPAGLWPSRLAPRPPVARYLLRPLAPVLMALCASAFGRRLLLGRVVAAPARVPAAAARVLIGAYLSAPGLVRTNSAMRAGRFSALEQISVPVTLIWPGEDRLLRPPRNLPAGIRSRELPGCGHLPVWDDPGAVVASICAGAQVGGQAQS